MQDTIQIEGLELQTHIGVPESERAEPQRVTVSLTLYPKRSFDDLSDSIHNTVDYFQVCQRIKALAARHPRQLIETLAQEIAEALLAEFALRTVQVELRKFILPDTAFVAVRLERSA